MTLTLTPSTEARLLALAQRHGQTPEAVIDAFVEREATEGKTKSTDFPPPMVQPDPTLALFAKRAEEDRTDDPEEIARRQRDGDELLAALQANPLSFRVPVLPESDNYKAPTASVHEDQMGYELYITRKEEWCDVEGPTISPEEWLTVVQHDPEFTITGLHGPYPYHADWSGPGKYPCWLDHRNGNLYSKNPTDEMIDKMVQIARWLDAKVQGDEGEVYLGAGQAIQQDHTGQWFVYYLTGQEPTT